MAKRTIPANAIYVDPRTYEGKRTFTGKEWEAIKRKHKESGRSMDEFQQSIYEVAHPDLVASPPEIA